MPQPLGKVATLVQGLVPVNFDQDFEFYLGIKDPDAGRFDGHRLFFDAQSTDLAPSASNTPHSPN